jgi:glutamate-1-semialdehyde 2,1-aminomutase
MTLSDFISEQRELFAAANPISHALSKQASAWRSGVPMHWMRDWATPFPIYVKDAKGAVLTDVDGHTYDDFCLGDTPSMFGHARPELAVAIAEQAAQGVGFMLPTEISNRVGNLLAQRFGLSVWQVATTASDANRAAIRWARAVTGRPKILVFDGCYHGMVDDCFVALYDGQAANKKGLIGQVRDQTETTTVIPFNDIAALEAALQTGDVAAVLAEPVMTNCGMILPQPGFHRALRDLTAQHGTLLILDETHTLSSAALGYSAQHGIKPDMLVIGKAIAGGVPAAVWGVTVDLAHRMDAAQAAIGPGSSGIGTTLSGNALAMRAMYVMLTEVMTFDAYLAMQTGAEELVSALRDIIDRHDLPWSVVHVGARAELIFAPQPPHDAAAMRKVLDHDLLEAFHLFLINRGVLIAPFHNMMLISPETESAAIQRLAAAVAEFAVAYKTFQPAS